MNTRDCEIAVDLKNKLSSVINLIDFRIFGSRATGNADEYSDMDVFLEVLDLNKELEAKIEDIVWDVSFRNLVLISPLLFTKDQLENSPLKSSPIVKEILRKGIKI